MGRPGHQLEPGCGVSTADAQMSVKGPAVLSHWPLPLAPGWHLGKIRSGGSARGDVMEGPDSEIAGERLIRLPFHSWAAGPLCASSTHFELEFLPLENRWAISKRLSKLPWSVFLLS